MIELNKRIKIIDNMIFDYTELMKVDNNQERDDYERLIVILNNQKLKIERFKSEIKQIA